jgi:hypothetical protein
MPVSAWLMLVFGCIVLYGGLVYFIHIARRNKRSNNKSKE